MIVAVGLTVLARGQEAVKVGAPPEAYLPGDPLPYFGSENRWDWNAFERPHKPITQSARIGQAQIIDLVEGRIDDALASCREWLNRDPGDGESRFNLVLALARSKRLEEAEKEMGLLLDLGFPPERFLAGPREFTSVLHGLATFKRRVAGQSRHLVHGPMLGAVRPDGVRLWVRTDGERDVEVLIVRDWDFVTTVARSRGRTKAADDYTAVLDISGLESDTTYHYRLKVAGVDVPRQPEWIFRTAPRAESAGVVRVAFGSGAKYTPETERVWDTIRLRRPLAFLTLGDNVYIDLPGHVNGLHRYTYYCRQSRPEWRRLTAGVPIYAIWDDHDCVTDDVFMGPYVDKPDWKLGHFQVFRQNWNNPAYGAEPEWPGAWFSFRLGNVEFFMLDGRFYRENWQRPNASMLGPVQKAWLLRALRASTATFKVLASSVPWADDAKVVSGNVPAMDTWGGYVNEREEILELLTKERINGVILISGDRHRGDVRLHERENGYPLYEIESARLTNKIVAGPTGRTLFVYTEMQCFCLLTFDNRPADPVATLEIVNIDGETVWRHAVALSELTVPGLRR